jgi:hypothetical protein
MLHKSIIKKFGKHFPKSGKCFHPDSAFFVKKNDTGFHSRYGQTITAMPVSEMPYKIQNYLRERANFRCAYENKPLKLEIEKECIEVYTYPMKTKAEINTFLNIAKDEGWILQHFDHAKFKVGSGKNVYWKFMFSDCDMIKTVFKNFDENYYQAWKELPEIKKAERTKMLLGSWKQLKPVEGNIVKVGILPIDTKGFGFIRRSILRHNGIQANVIKGSVLTKSIMISMNDVEIARKLRKFGVVLHTDYIKQFDVLLGNDEDKFELIGKRLCLDKFSYNPDHMPKDIKSGKFQARFDALMLDKKRPTIDISEELETLNRGYMTKEETVKYLAYKSGDKIDIKLGNWLAYLGLPLSECNPLSFWNNFGATIKNKFFKTMKGLTGTLLDDRLAPTYLSPKKGVSKYPPSLPVVRNQCTPWFQEGVIFAPAETIEHLVRDNDGDLAQWTDEKYFDHTIDANDWIQDMPKEIEVEDERTEKDVLIDQLLGQNYTGWIHSNHMVIASISIHEGNRQCAINAIMNHNRKLTEKFIMRSKYNMDRETPPTIMELAEKFNLSKEKVKREQKFASLVRNGRLDSIISHAISKNASINGPFFESIASQLIKLKITKKEIEWTDEMKTADNIRRGGFRYIKNFIINKYASHPEFDEREFCAGLDKRRPMFKLVGPNMNSENKDEQNDNLHQNMDTRFRHEVKMLKSELPTLDIHRSAEILLTVCILKKEFQYGIYLWNRYWNKERKQYEQEEKDER